MKRSIEQITEEKTNKEVKYLLFSVNDNMYAIELSYIFRVTGISQIYPVSRTPKNILGMMEAFDTIWSVMDLRTKFGKKSTENTYHLIGILLRYKEVKVCIIIDKILSVLNIAPADITPSLEKESYVFGSIEIENKIVNFLTVDNLFS